MLPDSDYIILMGDCLEWLIKKKVFIEALAVDTSLEIWKKKDYSNTKNLIYLPQSKLRQIK